MTIADDGSGASRATAPPPLLIDPAALTALHGGPLLLLALDEVGAATELALPGVALWLVRADPRGCRLYRPGADPALAVLPLPAPPAGVLAIVAPPAGPAAVTGAALLLAAWTAAAPEVPPLIEATEAAAAWPGLARLALARLAAQAVAAGNQRRALAIAREETEETRLAMAALLQASDHRAPPPEPELVLGTEPGTAGGVTLAGGAARERIGEPSGEASGDTPGPVLGQSLGVALEGVAALALHVDAAVAGPAARLRVRLCGVESGRVFGSWMVPGDALAPGWLHLDLAGPVGLVRETAWLEVRAAMPAGERVVLGLTGRSAPPGPGPGPGDTITLDDPPDSGPMPAATGGRALVVRLWSAPFGRRFVHPMHWNWQELELPLPLPGVPVHLSAPLWRTARLLSPEGMPRELPTDAPTGGGSLAGAALGAEPPRPLATLAGGEEAVLLLPAVPLAGFDLVQAALRVEFGDAGLLRAALWLPPGETPLAPPLAPSLPGPGAHWSGWRSADPAGGLLHIALPRPPEAPEVAGVALVLRNAGSRPEDLLRVAWTALSGLRLGPPMRAAPLPATAGPLLAAPILGAVRLREHLVGPDGSYRHLDITLEGLRDGPFVWPRLRVKFALHGAEPKLEFRIRPDWPTMFEAWPGQRDDAYGPFLLVAAADLAKGLAGVATEGATLRLSSGRDRAMLLALARLLPAAVATAAREANTDPAAHDRWLAAARRFTEAAVPPG